MPHSSTPGLATTAVAVDARRKLESASTIHWFHWMIVSGSLLLTFLAWQYSQSEMDARVQAQFDWEADHVIELVRERMEKYEDALWGGVGAIQASGGDIDFERWQRYADSLHVLEKYPGINGIGVIHAVENDQREEYQAAQQANRPDYQIHPNHNGNLNLPISYIVPVAGNERAVGLDMAHETNRFTAAKKARDSGRSQITAPISLVQETDKTPGFLFFAPYYAGGTYDSIEDRRNHFSGMVFAPFVVKKLMEGTLEKNKRHVGIRILDGEETLYNEHHAAAADYDPSPLFTQSANVNLFGRTWRFDIWSTKSFRSKTSDNQPLTILVGGIVIDVLLILLFISISRSSHHALHLADSMTCQLEARGKELESNQRATLDMMEDVEESRQRLSVANESLKRSNRDLEQFAYIASHDLQEPLRKIASFCGLLRQEYGEQLDVTGRKYAEFAIDGATRMRELVQDLLVYSKIGSEKAYTAVDATAVLELAISNLETSIAESRAIITYDQLPLVTADNRELCQLFQNLIGNSIKYRTDQRPEINIRAEQRGDQWKIAVSDNGIGIAPEYYDRIFGIFKRLHSKTEFSGTGIGLAICQRVVDGWNGKIWVEPGLESGSTFCFTIPKTRTDVSLQGPNNELVAVENSV